MVWIHSSRKQQALMQKSKRWPPNSEFRAKKPAQKQTIRLICLVRILYTLAIQGHSSFQSWGKGEFWYQHKSFMSMRERKIRPSAVTSRTENAGHIDHKSMCCCRLNLLSSVGPLRRSKIWWRLSVDAMLSNPGSLLDAFKPECPTK